MENRKEFLKKELIRKNVDILLVYSSFEDFGPDLALNKIRPIWFHYYFLDKNGKEGYLEIDYLIEDLKKCFNGKIIAFDERSPKKALSQFLEKYSRIAIGGNAPWSHLSKINKEIIDFNKEINIILRQKDEKEIKKIEEVAKITLGAFKKVEKFIRVNKNQKEIEGFLKKEFLGSSDKLSFPICITSGKDIQNTTAMMPSNKKILKKDIICIDAGIVKDGFYSDCTRMFFINESPAKEDYQKLLKAHQNSIKRIKDGVLIKEIVSIYEQELKKQNLPAETLEKADLGHSIGFKLHEDPIFFKEGQEGSLKENMVITLEPEINMGNYRIRVEDMILINKNTSRILTK